MCELGAVVVGTFAVCWAPFLAEPARAGDVLRRLAPLGRGLFEDYVANFWCSTSALIKWRQLFSQQVRHCRKHAVVHASNVQPHSATGCNFSALANPASSGSVRTHAF